MVGEGEASPPEGEGVHEGAGDGETVLLEQQQQRGSYGSIDGGARDREPAPGPVDANELIRNLYYLHLGM